MKNLILLSFLFFGFIACQGQENQKQKNEKTTTSKSPNENWTVHEQYDDDGNLISRDSTYSYSYSSINGQEVPPEKIDSLLSQIGGHFNGKNMQDLMQGFNGMNMDDFMQNFGDMSLNDFMQGFQGMDLNDFMQGFDEDFLSDSLSSEGEGDKKDPRDFHQRLMEQMKKMQEQFFQQHPRPNRRVIPRETPSPNGSKAEKGTPSQEQEETDVNLRQV